MSIATILKEKKVNRDNLIINYNLKNKKSPIGLISLRDELINSELIEALRILPANFIISGIDIEYENIKLFNKKTDKFGYDFLVCDKCDDNIAEYMKNGSVPIILQDNNIGNKFFEFNAASIEGNSFIFKNDNLCDIYYAIIRYLENFKFPYDNKALVKNVLSLGIHNNL